LTLLYARYWAGRGQYDQVVSLSDQLLAVNPDSPYIDHLLLLAAALKGYDARHDFGHRGHGAAFALVLAVHDLAGVAVDENRRLGGDLGNLCPVNGLDLIGCHTERGIVAVAQAWRTKAHAQERKQADR